jgi:geranylgeranyl diphosphate synthase type II
MRSKSEARVEGRSEAVVVNLSEYLKRRQARVDRLLERCIPAALKPEQLMQAMRYSLFSGGKRIRPILAMAATEAVGGPVTAVLPFACALELIHTYSLIHDDLPAMDDDEMRRGKPANHIVFGEALAILAGDALLTDAFRIMAEAATRSGPQQGRALQALQEIAGAAGSRGMVGGQAADMAAENTVPDLPTVEFIHVRKTGALIRAAVRAGALLGDARPEQLRRLTRYGEIIGLAFQLADDILDAEGSRELTGKNSGRDQERNKATFPAVMGLAETKERAQELLADALYELRGFGPAAEPLREIARFIVARACST